jgi:hypothetical protein
MWKAVEKAGFDWISVWDHLYPSQIDESKDCFEALSCHAALAAVTSAVRVGCLVYSAGYRHPGMLANAAVTIDHLSGGRLELGIGAGWHQHEYFAYGLPFEEPATRLRRLKEYVNVVRALFVEPTVDFDGEFFYAHRSDVQSQAVAGFAQDLGRSQRSESPCSGGADRGRVEHRFRVSRRVRDQEIGRPERCPSPGQVPDVGEPRLDSRRERSPRPSA